MSDRKKVVSLIAYRKKKKRQLSQKEVDQMLNEARELLKQKMIEQMQEIMANYQKLV